MPLPPPAARRPSHTRKVTYQGYRRDDGLWDIEAHLHDSKPFAFEVPGEVSWQANEAIHDLQIRLTLDNTFLVHAVAVAMNHVPHDGCPQAQAPMQRLVGARLTRGWRRTIEEQLGGVQGCTHLRELLFNMATAAFQTMPHVFSGQDPQVKPMHLDRCVTWDSTTELVQRRYPLHHRPRTPNAAETSSPSPSTP